MELDKITAFIRKHHVMTLATVGVADTFTTVGNIDATAIGSAVTIVPSGNLRPWVAHVFYAWIPEERCFVFTTDPETRHGGEMMETVQVAAAIALETRIVGRVQGLQIEGEVRRSGSVGDGGDMGINFEKARRAYLRRFPYAAAAGELSLWILEPTYMKLTDNTLGFGKKLIWTK